MITLAIIGASYLQRPLVETAKAMGLRTICFAWAEGAVCKDIVDAFYPISIVEKEQILAICRKEHIDGICTIASDVSAPTVAYVAEQMGLVGNSYEASLLANNKWLMRQAFTKANVPCPEFTCIKGVDGLEERLKSIQKTFQLPLIVKPSDRSGSLGVTKVVSWNALNGAVVRAMELSFKQEVMIEEFINGNEISVEYISYGGVHYPLQITDKITTGAPHFVELEHHQPSALPATICDEVHHITQKALSALGITNGASHSEYRITKEGKIYVMEIGARMGGDFIGSDLVQLSTGYDFVKGVIDVALGNFETPKKTANAHSGVYFLSAATPQVAHYIQHAQQYPAVVRAEQTDIELHDITCSAERSGYFIYRDNEKFVVEQ